MKIRTATMADLAAVAAVESLLPAGRSGDGR